MLRTFTFLAAMTILPTTAMAYDEARMATLKAEQQEIFREAPDPTAANEDSKCYRAWQIVRICVAAGEMTGDIALANIKRDMEYLGKASRLSDEKLDRLWNLVAEETRMRTDTSDTEKFRTRCDAAGLLSLRTAQSVKDFKAGLLSYDPVNGLSDERPR